MNTSVRLHVREYRPNDFHRLMEIGAASFTREMEAYGFDPASFRRQARLYRLVSWGQRLTGNLLFKILVGEAAGEIVGATALSRLGEAWYIAMVMVAPEHRRRGYGAAMIESTCREARSNGVKRIILHVLEDNTPAQNLYRLTGFAPFERSLHFCKRVGPVEFHRLPDGYHAKKIATFDRRAFDLRDAVREESAAKVYGRSFYPPFYLRFLFTLFRPERIERYAILQAERLVGVYTFRSTSKKEAAHAAVALHCDHRGQGIEQALLVQALARAQILGTPKLVAKFNAHNEGMLTACEDLGFARTFVMEGLVKALDDHRP